MAMIEAIKNTYKSSFVYGIIDKIVSRHFRKRLKNKEFTILCSNCIGGVIYHRLGSKFYSPTVNMFFSQPDFVDFCVHLEYYLSQKLCFIYSDAGYPIAELRGNGDIPTIRLNFNHSKSNEEAEKKWDERKERIRRDNLYIILYMLDGLTVEKAKELENVKCNNKVLLTSRHLPDISWSYYIKPNERQKYASSYLGKDIFGVRYFEKKFDFVSFLNKGAHINAEAEDSKQKIKNAEAK